MKTLVMTFQNEAGRNVSLRLRYPKGTLTNQEVKTLMDAIIEKKHLCLHRWGLGGQSLCRDPG